MNYRDMLGFSKKQPKKKVVKKQPKPSITEGLKKQFGDTINESAPLGKMDKIKFMKYFDLSLKTAGSDKADIYKILKRMMPSLDNRTLLYIAQGIADAVKQSTGEE